MTRYSYDVCGMAKVNGLEEWTLAQHLGVEPEFYDVMVYRVNEDGEREFADPVWEFEGLASDDVMVVTSLVEEKLQATLGEEL